MGYATGNPKFDLPECLTAAGIVGAWAHDTATDLVIADAGCARLFGISNPDPANGDPIRRYIDAIHPADRNTFINEVAAASHVGGSFSSQYRIRTSAGVRWVHDYGSFTVDADGNPLQGHGIILDVTGRRRDVDIVDEIATHSEPSEQLKNQLNVLSRHIIASSEIVRALPSTRLRAMTDPLLFEVGRLLAWAIKRPA